MAERPYSRYTRARTRAAMHSQHINAGYAIVPWSATENSIDVISCKDSGNPTQNLAKDTQSMVDLLYKHADEFLEYYAKRETPDKAPAPLAEAIGANRYRPAVVLARSSDFYYYHLEDNPEFKLVICGLHDSYLFIPAWEMRTNKRYRPRETAIAITGPDFDRFRCTSFGHNILVAAYAKGDPDAIAFIERKDFPERTRSRLRRERDELQYHTYRGRPLAFRTDAKRKEVSMRISEGLKRYHASKYLRII